MQESQFSTEAIIAEVRKLQYLYQLKQVIRYDQQRVDTDISESVAEHIYGLIILSRYFLPLESRIESLDESKVWQMMLWHDIDEIETGDVLGYKKTPADIAREQDAEQIVIGNAPESVQSEMVSVLSEYRQQKTRDARFVKALDKFEPQEHLYNEKGKRIIHSNGTTAQESLDMKTPYLSDFPYITRFCLTLQAVMEKEGYFVSK